MIGHPAVRTLLICVGVFCASVAPTRGLGQIAHPMEKLATIEPNSITESSGVAVAHVQEGGLWTHNDSGHPPVLYLLSNSGEQLGEFKLKDAKCVDWEDMSAFRLQDRNLLMIGDVGDNARSRTRYQLYVLEEPAAPKDKKNEVEQALLSTLTFQYEDGPHDCEAIAVDSRGGQVLLIEKINFGVKADKPPGIYQLPFKKIPDPEAELVAKRIGEFSARAVTGADISPDGTKLVIRTYLLAYLFQRDLSQDWQDVLQKTKPWLVALPLQVQGEAICFSADSNALIVTSEGRNQPIWQIDLTTHERQVPDEGHRL